MADADFAVLHLVDTPDVGDEGARPYLAARDDVVVECADLATGADIDAGGPVS